MKKDKTNIGLVTPLRDELSNIDLLIKSISKQEFPIKYWVIIENGSTDGSKEYLDKLDNIPGVENFIVINFSLPNDKYELGLKYATVVNEGFKYYIDNNILEELNYVGILDADCFPLPNYYKDLVAFMQKDSKIGISSGLGYNLSGIYDGMSKSWVRGNCRLWTQECFLDAGYLLGPSADTLSACKAELKNWLVIPNTSLKYNCREVGQKVNYEYYGYSSYFRGITPFYASIKILKFVIQGRFSNAKGFSIGYFSSYFRHKKRIEDQEIYKYFSNYLYIKIKQAIARK